MAVALSNLSATWSTSAAAVNTAMKLDVLDLGSSANSRLLDLKTNSISQFIVDKTGRVEANSLNVSLVTNTLLLNTYSIIANVANIISFNTSALVANTINANNLIVSGNVGIGIQPTLGKLHIAGNVYATTGYTLPNDMNVTWGDGSVNITANSNSDILTITTANTSRIVIGGDGGVQHYGPGLTSYSSQGYLPQYTLISGNTSSGAGAAPYFLCYRARGSHTSPSAVVSGDTIGNIFFGGYDGSAYQLSSGITATVSATTGVNDLPGTLSFLTASDGTVSPLVRMSIEHNGYILMGYASSQGAYKLQVFGGAGLSGATAWTNLSDRRLKSNVTPILDGLSRVLRLKPVNYDFINKEDHPDIRERGGFIAQDVIEVFPEFVTKDATPTGKDKELLDGDKTAYDLTLTNKFHAYLVAAIQEQQKIIDSLEKRLAVLEKT